MKFLLQECIVRGKQIQVPYAGKKYKSLSGWRHGSGGWINLNVCAPGDAKLGHTLAEEIVKVLRAHGYEFDTADRNERMRARGKKKKAVRRKT